MVLLIMECDFIMYLLANPYETYSWIALGTIALVLLILRICMKNFIPSVIMCFVFSAITVYLSIQVFSAEDPSELGPWILYTTFSTLMFCLGPNYFAEGTFWEVTFYTGIFTTSVDVDKRSVGYKFYYFLSRLGIAFLWVNIIGFGGTPALLFVIPGICSLICLVRLIKYYK